MLKRSIRWLVPLLVIAAFAAYFVVAPSFSGHAATATPTHSVSDGSGTTPDILWNH